MMPTFLRTHDAPEMEKKWEEIIVSRHPMFRLPKHMATDFFACTNRFGKNSHFTFPTVCVKPIPVAAALTDYYYARGVRCDETCEACQITMNARPSWNYSSHKILTFFVHDEATKYDRETKAAQRVSDEQLNKWVCQIRAT